MLENIISYVLVDADPDETFSAPKNTLPGYQAFVEKLKPDKLLDITSNYISLPLHKSLNKVHSQSTSEPVRYFRGRKLVFSSPGQILISDNYITEPLIGWHTVI